MNIIKTIYALPIYHFHTDDQCGESYVEIVYNGKVYKGFAQLHPQDAEFYSPRVGKAIALSKARMSLIKDRIQQAKKIAEIKYQLYQEVIGYGQKAPAEVDPTGAFLRNVIRAQANVRNLKTALKKERESLKNYLTGYSKATASVRKLRESRAQDSHC